MPDTQQIVGRFAPSPTGPLHIGSLYTALASYLDARSRQGQWLLRIDDLDTTRNVKGAKEQILKTLEAFGLTWDQSVFYQSQHLDDYHAFLYQLKHQQLLYPCTCSRKTLADSALASENYPGFCRDKTFTETAAHAIRIKTDQRTIAFQDSLQGLITQPLTSHGDFILKRKDQIVAYQFAVVIDDYLQGVNHVVRGVDLLEVTPRQIYLHQVLGLNTPEYMHVPVLVDSQGHKLSKQTLAQAVDAKSPERTIFTLLGLLKQNPPGELENAPINELLDWAQRSWSPGVLKGIVQLPAA
ncbi:MAG: tRNA glutamyl-Q(34) synthetase GluQRS [Methylococcales bacterium]